MKDNIVRLTEDEMTHLIKGCVKDVLLEHGIDIKDHPKYRRRCVVYNPSHQDNIDTSIEGGLTIYKEKIGNFEVTVYSMFKRKPRKNGERGDGNPALYALKREREWVMDNEQEFMQQFENAVKEWLKTHTTQVVIPIPSTNDLNARIISCL